MSLLADHLLPGAGETATRHEARFRAMGTDCHLVVLGATPEHLEVGELEIRRLESLWSRFLPTSDVGRLNAADGASVPVHPDTRLLLDRAVEARTQTDGWFDPFIGPPTGRPGLRP